MSPQAQGDILSPPTYNPTVSDGSSAPTTKPVEISGLKVTLFGILSIESNYKWEDTTSEFYQSVYDDNSDMSEVTVVVELTDVQPSTTTRRILNSKDRALQGDPSVEVTYTQTMSYRSDDPNLTIEKIVQMPLDTQNNRNMYVRQLKNLDGYAELTDVTEIAMTSDAVDGDNGTDGNNGTDGDNTADEKKLPLGAIIGGAGAGAALLILIGGFVYYKKRTKDEENELGATNTVSSTQDAQTGVSGAGTGSSVPTYGETSVATVDYDYSRAYGGAGAHSLSDAGGTVGSRTRQTAAEDADPAMLPGSGNTIFSDDNTFDQAYEDVREELLDIYAPAGKLGVVIDTPNDGAPVVHAVKDSSAIAAKVQVGDKLVAVDDEDVRAMTAIKVSKLISRKSNNASRKLTIIRHVSNNS